MENKNVVKSFGHRYKGGRYIRNGGFQEQSHGVESGGEKGGRYEPKKGEKEE